MLRPDIFAGIKQPDKLACLLVRSRDVRALMRVAMQARERKIVEGGLASVLACNHVVVAKRFVRWRSNMAIFASGSGTLTDLLAISRFTNYGISTQLARSIAEPPESSRCADNHPVRRAPDS